MVFGNTTILGANLMIGNNEKRILLKILPRCRWCHAIGTAGGQKFNALVPWSNIYL